MTTRKWTALLSSFGLLMLILDAKTALYGASEGIEMCLRSVIPSLFPFFVLSALLTGAMNGLSVPALRPLGAVCGIPRGSESILAVGLLGGYPVGAQTVAQACREGRLSRQTARRMLGFCSNAGPAFFFGIVGSKFPRLRMAWALWGIHILSAVLTGALLPGKTRDRVCIKPGPVPSPSDALERSVRVMACVCGWVILFRVMIAFLERWVLWLLPKAAAAAVAGLLELSNGCLRLGDVENVGLRFILASGMLSMGSLCVTMQTVTATRGLGLGMYLPGKALQAGISTVLAFVWQLLFFPAEEKVTIGLSSGTVLSLFLVLGAILIREQKKRSSISAVYGV